MIKNVRVIFVLLSVLLIIFTSLIVRFWLEDDTVLIKDQPEAPTISFLGGNYYSFRIDGLYGVKDNKGKVLIDARWKSVEKLDSDRFAVSVSESGVTRYGIIDASENVVVPFIYTGFETCNREVILAQTERNSFVLFDYSGNVIISEEFERITKNYQSRSLSAQGNYIQLEKGKNLYRISVDKEGRRVMSEIRFERNVFGENRFIKISNTSVIPGLENTGSLYEEVFDTSCEYIDALFEGDSARIKNIAWSTEYRELMLEGHNLRGSEIKSVETPVPVISEETDGTVEYKCRTTVVYETPDNVRWGGDYTYSEHTMSLQINLKKNEDGRLTVFKVYASKLN